MKSSEHWSVTTTTKYIKKLTGNLQNAFKTELQLALDRVNTKKKDLNYVLDSDKRDCDEMNTIAKLFVLLAICCCFAIVISGAGFINSIFAITQTRRDQVRPWCIQGVVL